MLSEVTLPLSILHRGQSERVQMEKPLEEFSFDIKGNKTIANGDNFLLNSVPLELYILLTFII
jgi:hypothetical protein